MMDRRRRGIVRLDGTRVGLIEETERGVRFAYDPAYVSPEAIPISLTLPVQKEPYEWPRLQPFFENLLPEGWLLDIALRRLHLPESDTFGLLLATCGDCIGAVEIIAEEAVSAPDAVPVAQP